MSGIRIDTEWLARHSADLRATGRDVGSAGPDLETAVLTAETFGEWGRVAGAEESYSRISELLRQRTGQLGEVLVTAADELRRVAEDYVEGDGSAVGDLPKGEI